MTKQEIPQLEPRLHRIDDYFNYTLRNERIEAGYTINELARLIGVSISTICSYERMRVVPEPLIAKRIAIALNEKLRRSESVDDYVTELFPEHLHQMVSEIKKERGYSQENSKDALDHSIPLDDRVIIQSSHSSEDLPEIVQELYQERIEEIPLVPEPQLEAAQYQDLLNRIGKVLRTLPYREREIVKLRYGLEDGYSYSQEEVGHMFKITRSRIGQIEAKAIRKLQQPSRSQELVGFLD